MQWRRDEHGGADGDLAARLITLLDDGGVTQLLFELCDLVLEHRLLVLRRVVLGVLREVAELARLFDGLRNLATALGGEVVETLLELAIPLGGEDDFLGHGASGRSR